MSKSLPNKLWFLLLLTSTALASVAQQAKDTSTIASSGKVPKPGFVTTMQKRGTDEALRSIEKYKAGQIALKQIYLIEEIKNTTQRASIFMKKGLDTLAVVKEMENTTASVAIVRDGVFINKGTVQTQRNLAVSSAILAELINKMVHQQTEVKNYSRGLVAFRDKIDSISADTTLYTFSSDSVTLTRYLKKIGVVVKEIGPIDSALDHSSSYVQDLQNKVDLMIFSLRSQREDIEKFRQDLTTHTFDRELSNIAGPAGYRRPLKEILQFSLAKEKLTFSFYFNENRGILIILVLLIAATTFFIQTLKKRLKEDIKLADERKGKLVFRHPLLSAIIVIVSLFQFVFLEPPFIFIFCFWLVPSICLSIIFNNFISKYWMRFWMVIVLLFILASANNMILQASRQERWFMLLLAATGVGYGAYILLKGQHQELKERGILYFIGFMVIAETGATLFNVFGRYNLSKTLLISGYAGLAIAILFLWTVRLINQVLSVTSGIYRHNDKKLFYINFDKLGDQVPSLFYVLLVLGWLILVGRNFYEFKQIAAPFSDFLNNERTLGDYTFTIRSLFVFFLILISSMMLSRLISFIASEPEQTQPTDKKNKKVSLGSWLLLIRILIISIGLFLAFAAAGIPMDKLTIILGALGVGIGLGLQGLVNNLVSGLIIAFEKPVNVGDLIEVNSKPGTMKSIGFRSSVVTLSDGACLIIPNGDLLSQHLVNWTMGKNIKQLNITLGVAYDSNLEKVTALLKNILDADERILKYPASAVIPKNFGDNSIEINLFFWVRHIRESAELRGDIITEINGRFKADGIVIPFPQQDLHIRSIENMPAVEKEKTAN